MSTLDMEARFLATDVRNLTDDLTQIKAWIGHWQEDVASNLKPTTESLDAAMHRVKTALRAIDRIREDARPKRDQRLFDAIVSLGFGSERADERIGWRGTCPAPSTNDHFRCEFCVSEHIDHTNIHHADTCPVTLLRAAMSSERQTAEAA